MGIQIEVQRIQLPGNRFLAWFHSAVSDDIDVETLPVVSLARNPDHCFFRVDQLADHDSHAPAFDDRPSVDAYIQRVHNDIANALAAMGIKMDEGTVEDAKGVPIGNVHIHEIHQGGLKPGDTLSDN